MANKVFNIAAWAFVAVFAVLFWFIYLAESETQTAVMNVVFGVWGLVSGLAQLAMGLSLLWSAAYFWWKIRSISGGRGCAAVLAALAWTAFAVPAGLWLVFLGVFGLIA